MVAAIQTVELLLAELAQVVGRGVGSPEVEQVQIRIVGKSVPDDGAALELGGPVLVPGLVGRGQLGVLVRFAGLARDRVEAPLLSAAVDIVRGDITAHPAVPHVPRRCCR